MREAYNIPALNFFNYLTNKSKNIFLLTDNRGYKYITNIDKTKKKTFIETIDLDKQYERYNIDIQINDLLDQSLANIPNINRTTKIYNDIYSQIERYKELRQQFSIFDEYKNMKESHEMYKNQISLIITILQL